jgi:hypothetical protein
MPIRFFKLIVYQVGRLINEEKLGEAMTTLENVKTLC